MNKTKMEAGNIFFPHCCLYGNGRMKIRTLGRKREGRKWPTTLLRHFPFGAAAGTARGRGRAEGSVVFGAGVDLTWVVFVENLVGCGRGEVCLGWRGDINALVYWENHGVLKKERKLGCIGGRGNCKTCKGGEIGGCGRESMDILGWWENWDVCKEGKWVLEREKFGRAGVYYWKENGAWSRGKHTLKTHLQNT